MASTADAYHRAVKTNNQLRFSDAILLLDAAAKNDLDEEGNNNNNITEDTRETTFLF